MLERIQRFISRSFRIRPPVQAPRPALEPWRDRIFRLLALLLTFLGGPLLLFGAYTFARLGRRPVLSAVEAAICLGLLASLHLRKIPLTARKLLAVGMVYLVSILLLLFTGRTGAGFPSVLFTFILAVSLLEKRQVWGLFLANLGVFLGLSLALSRGALSGWAIETYSDTWAINVVTTQGYATILILLFNLILDGLFSQARDLAASRDAIAASEQQYRELSQQLEERVRERTAALTAANRELEKANQAKQDFLANMSHDLRTPLTGILGLTEVLQTDAYGAVNPAQKKALDTIAHSGQMLMELISDILDLSKIQAERMELFPEVRSVEEICRVSLHVVEELARRKGQQVSLSVQPDGAMISADPRRLKQMLVNLLSNAVKFTPAGGHLGLEVGPDLSGSRLLFSVWDSGVGITVEDREKLFQPFTQVGAARSFQEHGTGLGLSLVARLAELHGGWVSVESEPGQGSRFTVDLPWRSEAPE